MGQSRDFTAIAVLERAELTGEFDPAMFAWRKNVALRLRYLERMPLARAGAPGDAVSGDRGAGVADDESAGTGWVVPRGGGRDGGGRPVVDLLRVAGLGATMLPAIITGGAAAEFQVTPYGRIADHP